MEYPLRYEFMNLGGRQFSQLQGLAQLSTECCVGIAFASQLKGSDCDQVQKKLYTRALGKNTMPYYNLLPLEKSDQDYCFNLRSLSEVLKLSTRGPLHSELLNCERATAA